MSNKNDNSFSELITSVSKFFNHLQETCEKYKRDLAAGKKPEIEVKKVKKKIIDPLKSDPLAPKKPIIQGYLLYYSDVRAKRQKEHSDLPNKDLTRIIADEWNKMEKSKRLYYEDKAKANKKEYDEILEEYLKKNPVMREALGQKGKKKKKSSATMASSQKSVTNGAAAPAEVISIDDEDEEVDDEAPPVHHVSGALAQSSSDESSEEDSDDINSSDEESQRKKQKH